MTTFTGFSDAAKLFAKNVTIVEAMKDKHDQSVSQFLESLREATEVLLDREVLSKWTGNRHYYMWPKGKADDSCVGEIYGRMQDATIVTEGKLTMAVHVSEAPEDTFAAVAALAGHKDLRQFCSPGTGNHWTLFRVHLEGFADGELGPAAERLSKVMKVVQEILD